jgi:HSP20 family protein
VSWNSTLAPFTPVLNNTFYQGQIFNKSQGYSLSWGQAPGLHMARRNPFDELQQTIERMGRQFEDARKRIQDTTERASRQAGDTAEYAGQQAGDTVEYAGQQAGDTAERVSSEVEDTAASFGTQMRSGLQFSDVEVDIVDRDDEIAVTADLAGFETDEIDAQLSGQTLRIVADREESTEEREEAYLRRERRRSSVRRSVVLPGGVDVDNASAEYTNGVLTVTIPKASSEDSRSLDIN